MYGKPLAKLTSRHSDASRVDYEVHSDVVVTRTVSEWETVEWICPLHTFTLPEVEKTLRKPLVLWTELTKALCFFGFIAGPAGLYLMWKALATGEPGYAVVGVPLFSVLVAFLVIVRRRYVRHDWRNWRIIEFRCPRDDGSAGLLAVWSDVQAVDEQNEFLEALRTQIRLARQYPPQSIPEPREQTRGAVLATLVGTQSDGSRWEYELYRDVVQLHYVCGLENKEYLYRLCKFTSEEFRRTFRKPFIVWTESTNTLLGLLLCLAILPGVGLGLLDIQRGNWLGGVVGVGGAVVGYLVFVGYVRLRYALHDKREWRCVEFKCPEYSSPEAALLVVSEQGSYAKQDKFLNELRAQIRRLQDKPVL